jgi:hypothetical protein
MWPFFETVLRNCKLLPRFEQLHQEISAGFATTLFAGPLFSVRVIQKHDVQLESSQQLQMSYRDLATKQMT